MPSEYMMKLVLSFIWNIPDENSLIRMLVFLQYEKFYKPISLEHN